MIGEQLIGKDSEGSSHGPIEAHSCIFLEALRKKKPSVRIASVAAEIQAPPECNIINITQTFLVKRLRQNRLVMYILSV
jgi:hypothetical protein